MKAYIEAGYGPNRHFRATRTIKDAIDHYVFVASCLSASPEADDKQREIALNVLSLLAWYRRRRWQLAFGLVKAIYFKLPLRYGSYEVRITTINPWNPPCQR